MGGFTDRWFQRAKGDSLTQKVYGRVKPEQPLKPKIDEAQKKLQLQIQKLESIQRKLQEKDSYIFKRVVEAVRVRNDPYSRAYAAELHEIRKMNNMVTSAKLSLEQIQIRLNTMSELGDVVVTLSPCMSILKGLGTNLGGIIPEANSSMQDLSDTLGEIMSGASVSQQHEEMASAMHDSGSQETKSILEEASAILEGQVRHKIPDVPQEFSKSKAPSQENAQQNPSPVASAVAAAGSDENTLTPENHGNYNDYDNGGGDFDNKNNNTGKNTYVAASAPSSSAPSPEYGLEYENSRQRKKEFGADIASKVAPSAVSANHGDSSGNAGGNGNADKGQYFFDETKITSDDPFEQLVQKNQYYNNLRKQQKEQETTSSIFTT